MNIHERVPVDALGIVALPASDPDRVTAYEHAERCATCAASLEGAAEILRLMDALPPEPGPSPAARARLLEAIAAEDAALPTQAGIPWIPVLCATAVLAAVFHLEGASSAPAPSAIATLLFAALGVGGVALSPRLGVRALGIGAIAALAATVRAGLGGGADALAPTLGTKCALLELSAAAIPMAAALIALRRGGQHARVVVAAGAMSGALSAQAALAHGCPSTALLHGLVFHAGAVFVATLAAAGLARVVAGRSLREA